MSSLRAAAVLVACLSLVLACGCEQKAQPATEPPGVTPTSPSQTDLTKLPGDNGQPADPTISGSAGGTVTDQPTVTDQAGGAAAPRVHIVARGDTYWNLAVRYYGDGKKANLIREANGNIPDNKLPIGKQLIIP